jgi:hypothetical protein
MLTVIMLSAIRTKSILLTGFKRNILKANVSWREAIQTSVISENVMALKRHKCQGYFNSIGHLPVFIQIK